MGVGVAGTGPPAPQSPLSFSSCEGDRIEMSSILPLLWKEVATKSPASV